MKIILIIVAILFFEVKAQTLKDLQVQITNCKSNQLDEVLKNLHKYTENKMKNLNQEAKENLFYKEGLESQVITLFGSKYLSQETRLSLGAKACGFYMNSYMDLLLENKKESNYFKLWKSCMEADYRDNLPRLAKDLISCSQKEK